MNHKLRVLVQVDLDPGRVTLEIAGCLTRANFAVLLHLLLRAQRLAAGHRPVPGGKLAGLVEAGSAR